jgi:hypothetical protein
LKILSVFFLVTHSSPVCCIDSTFSFSFPSKSIGLALQCVSPAPSSTKQPGTPTPTYQLPTHSILPLKRSTRLAISRLVDTCQILLRFSSIYCSWEQPLRVKSATRTHISLPTRRVPAFLFGKYLHTTSQQHLQPPLHVRLIWGAKAAGSSLPTLPPQVRAASRRKLPGPRCT